MTARSKLLLGGLGLLAVGLIWLWAFQPFAPQIDPILQRGDQLLAQGRRTEARAAYQQAAELCPDDPQPWLRLGDLYRGWGRPEAAREAYAQALRRGAERPAVGPGLARTYTALGNDRAAADEWRRYLSQRDDRDARLALARTHLRLSHWELAQSELERLLEGAPDDAEAHAWLGLLLLGPDPMNGMPHLQIAAADPGLISLVGPFLSAERAALASDDPAYRLTLLGAAFLRADEVALAQRTLSAAVLLNETYAEAHAYLGQALDRAGQPDQAQAALAQARQLDPNSEVALTLSGLFWDRRGAPQQARDYFFAAYELDQDNAALCLEIAETFVAQEDYLGAEVWLNEAIALAPDDPQVWEPVTRFYLDHRLDVELAGTRSASQWNLLAPDDPQAHEQLGLALALTGQETAAEGQFLTALELNPDLALAHYHLGQLYFHQGRYAEAARAYLRAADCDVDGGLSPQLRQARRQFVAQFGGMW